MTAKYSRSHSHVGAVGKSTKLMPLLRIKQIFVAPTSHPVLTAMALGLEESQSNVCLIEMILGLASTMIVKFASPQGDAFEKDARCSKGV